MINHAATMAGYLVLGIFLGIVVMAVLIFCCTPMMRYFLYAKKAVGVYRDHKEKKKKKRESEKQEKEIGGGGHGMAHDILLTSSLLGLD